ncbi:MAG: hypothetical protein HS101_03260 [Planctomycetia bacterium]|nr:hypothetical protein [Planctomycetia bacterium]MCC7316238.1 hypothetical protein [Planctomycetota bacterium]
MTSVHTVTMWAALSICTVGLLGQSNGCDLNALINVVFQQGSAGDDIGTNGVDDANTDGFDDANSNGIDDDAESNGIDDNGGGGNNSLRINAELTGSTAAHGDAEYRKDGSRRRLSVELEDAAVGTLHDVSVGGIFIGQLTIGALGQGELEFDTHIEPGHLPWPNSLPTELEVGTSVQVGPASGLLGQ